MITIKIMHGAIYRTQPVIVSLKIQKIVIILFLDSVSHLTDIIAFKINTHSKQAHIAGPMMDINVQAMEHQTAVI